MKMNRVFLIEWGLLASVLFLASSGAASQDLADSQADIQPLIQQGDGALPEITEANCWKAIAAYEEGLKITPESYEANWKASKAYCLILDLRTAGLIEEKDEYKPFLKELGAKAEHYAEKAYAQNAKGLEALIWYNSSYGYHASSMGILKAILKGAGGKLKELAKELIEIDDSACDALGYRMLGRFYLNAPFPAGSKKKAVQYLEKAVTKAPASLFNHYWLGNAHLAREKLEDAKKEFQFVLDHPPSENEKHFFAPIKEAAQKRLRELSH